MDGQDSQQYAETSMDTHGILVESQTWIVSQRASLVAILAALERAQDWTGNQQDQRGEDVCRQSMLFDQHGFSSKTPHGSNPTGQQSGEHCETEDTIPEMVHLMPAMSERRTKGGVGLCSRVGPTLTRCGNHNRKGASANSGDGLATWCKKLMPTLYASDHKNPYSQEGYQKQAARRSKPLRDTAKHTIGIRLTPDFCEWWMGWPIGASASLHSATHGCRSKRRRHGSFSVARESGAQPQPRKQRNGAMRYPVGFGDGYGFGFGDGYGDGNGDGYGDGLGDGDGDGNGYGYGFGDSDSYGDGYGDGYGYGFGDSGGYGGGHGFGDGDGDGYGYGNGNGRGYGYGYGFGTVEGRR
jgi:hypothetical protein